MAAGITRITIAGYKSIVKEQSIEIAPLTILAGANSSGKSSMIQPLLLLKQTLEAPFDPGGLLINGPILKFTSSSQFLSRTVRVLRILIEAGRKAPWDVRVIRGRDRALWGAKGPIPKRSLRIVNVRPGPRAGLRRLTLGVDFPEEARPIATMLHVRGLRGNPERNYPVTAVEEFFPGIFEHYVASIIESWQIQGATEVLAALNADLDHLDLNSGVLAVRVNEAQLELRVKRTKGAKDLVNLVDVGFGVAQAVPILVALRVADAGQMVYVEEPEIHLHPRAQTRMADVLAAAAKRGVKVVVETHSSLLLTAIQTLVAKGELAPDLVRLHWFQRHPRTGITKVTGATLDENGAFGDWPEDFGDVILSTEKAYLDAVESNLFG
jgi:predicted ATPase